MSVPRFLAVLVVLIVCSLSLVAQPAPLRGSEPPPAPSINEAPKVPPVSTDAVSVSIDPRTYTIGAEDILAIKTWREPEFTFNVAVRPDGKITVPLINDIQAGGLTPDRLGAQLTQAPSEYLNKPQITISVLQVNSKKYFITGQVNRPGQYPLVVETHVFDALSNAGGFRDFANQKDIIIVRGDQRIKFNYNEVLKGKNLKQNILVENGDIITVK